MSGIELALPAMGEGIIEATIIKWLVSEGDMVNADQPLLEIATDKVDSEIPSPARGIISKILMKEGEVPAVGDILAVIEKENDAEDHQPETSRSTRGKFLTPLVRNIARKENIPFSELDRIQGSGEGGRINKNDILEYLEKRKGEKAPDTDTFLDQEAGEEHESATEGTGIEPAPRVLPGEGDRVIGMDRLRKLIARNMVISKRTSPHVTSFIDTDVTGMVTWREKNKSAFLEREKQNLTYTPLIIEAVAKALKDYRMINISVDGTNIIIRKNINIGFAVALEDDKLIVPVIKNSDEKNLFGLVKAVNDLVERARSGKLKPEEITGGTFTVTNFGTFKNTTGIPIINQPEVAILGAGAIIKKPVVISTPQGDVIAIRHIMTLSLSYDHRVVDGALGGKFLHRISGYLENFDTGRTI
jgi:2-oxoglutarate dehydrogenase E2 component (dihydrolipoamide succinyltransferase)